MTFRHATGLLLVTFAACLGPTARGQVGAPLSAEITIREIPAQLETSGSAAALVDVHNTGTRTWPAHGDVRLAYHWFDGSGGLVQRDGERTLLPVTVHPGDTVRLCAKLIAPGAPGAYQVEWEMVREGVGWFAEDSGSDRRRTVAISAPGTPGHPSIPLLIFFAITLGHFFMTGLWMRRPQWTIGSSPDEQLFAGVVVGLGSLMAVLHLIACTIGLSMSAVAVAVIGGHLVIGLVTLLASRSPSPPREAAGEGRVFNSHSSPAEVIFEWVGTTVLVAIGVHWFATAAASMAVTGTDAEHYHVPNAINLALGANPLNFVATPHLYPMGTSVLAAWFILPLNDPLLIDLTLVLPFLLAFSALALLFRLVANASGLAWVPWFVLPLFATPMLQISSLMSADLMYAASFLAANTQLFRMWRRRAASFADLVITSLAVGMLVGSKTTGAVSAALLLSTYGLLFLLSSWRPIVAWRPRRPLLVAAGAAVAIGLAIASGGIWAVRNWINFGSPLAPSGLSAFGITLFPGDSVEGGRYYLSVLRDVRDLPGYDAAARAAFFTRQWFGQWFLPLTLAALPMVVEAVAVRRRVYAAERLWLFVIVAVLTLPHAALLVQAPWSSLEWTRGLALRYALPFFILWPFLAFLAMFPVSWHWAARRRPALALGTMMAGTALVLFARNAQLPGVPSPTDTSILLISLTISLLIVFRWSTWPGRAGRLSRIVGLALMVTLIWRLSSMTAVADERLRQAAVWGRDSPMECVDLYDSPAVRRYTAVYATVLNYERRSGRSCERRRFFVAARFDSPMALQPPPYTNLVYDARPRTMVERAMAHSGPGAEACDYVIASEAELQTDRGNTLVNRLRAEGALIEVGASPPYVIFHPPSRTGSAASATHR